VNEQDAIETAHNKGQQLKALEIAKKMLGAGMDIETITAMTDLSPDLIEREGD
jgi:predicted transposase YdaD